MPISSGGSGVPGDSPRQFPWQVDHNAVRGGPNDPILQTAPVTGTAVPSSLGSVSWNTTFTLNPVAGQNPPTPRTMSLFGAGSVSGGAVINNTTSGGLLLLTIPKGAWIQDIELYTYTSLSVGNLGIFYVPNSLDLSYPPGTATAAASSNMFLLCGIATPAAGTLYGLKSGSGVTAFGILTGASPALGPGVGGVPATPNISQLASLDDINIYVMAYGSTAPTAGCFAVEINFTGLEG